MRDFLEDDAVVAASGGPSPYRTNPYTTLRDSNSQAIDELMAWPLRVTQVRGLFADAWRLRANVTFADAVYVALAEHLSTDMVSDDIRLANTPRLPVRVLHLP